MKNLLAIFLILLITNSNATNTNLKKEVTEIEKLKAKQGGMPKYSKTPFQLYIDKNVHGEMQSPSKLFYFKKDLTKDLKKLNSTNTVFYLKSFYKNQQKIFPTKVYIPTQMARLEVELFINHFNFNIYDWQKFNFSMDIYMGSTKIGTTEYKGDNQYHYYVHKSMYVNGEIFNVPAGNYDFYCKFDSKSSTAGYYSYKFRKYAIHQTNEYNYRYYLDYDLGYFEITGYPLN